MMSIKIIFLLLIVPVHLSSEEGIPAEDIQAPNNEQDRIRISYRTHNIDYRNISASVLEDGLLTVPQLIVKYGYVVEEHKVESYDGYILTMHRMPNPNKQPVFLMHGLMDSSGGWIFPGPADGLGYILYNKGYDVWMGNARGNRYSRSHKTLNPKSKEFWKFSFHEIGLNDVPAMIDFALNKTGHQKIHYIGHSQGTTTFWVMCSMRPEYNEKILSMQALAPVAYLKECSSPLILTATHYLKMMETLYSSEEFLPNTDFKNYISRQLCTDNSIMQTTCKTILYMIAGYNREQLNKTALPILLGHVPAGISSRQVIHFGQLKKSGEFQQYDFRGDKNLEKYGSLFPPEYDLSKITANITLHYSVHDIFSHPEDVQKLIEQLPKKPAECKIEFKFNHLDFVWGIDAKMLVFDKVIAILNGTDACT